MKNKLYTLISKEHFGLSTISPMVSSENKTNKPIILFIVLFLSLTTFMSGFAQSSNNDNEEHHYRSRFELKGYWYEICNEIDDLGYFIFNDDIGFDGDCFAVCYGYNGGGDEDDEQAYLKDRKNISILSNVPMIEYKRDKSYKRIEVNRGTCPVLFFSGAINWDAEKISFPSNIKKLLQCNLGENVISVNLPPSIKSIPSNFLCAANKITSISIPDEVEILKYGAIEDCKNLKDIHLPEKLKTIEDCNLSYLPSLEAIKVPDNVETIGYSFLKDCINLKKVYLGKSVKSIGIYAFRGSNITEITCMAKEPPVTEGFNFSREVYNATLIVPESSKEKYMEDPVWKNFFIKEGSMDIQAYRGHMVNGQQANGVTADGESQLRFIVSFKDEDFEVNSYEISLLVDGKETKPTNLTGSFNNFGIQDNKKWGFIYTAPQEYPEDNHDLSYEVTVNLKLRNNKNKEVNVSRIITVLRPGVILLHGFNSNPSYLRDLQIHLGVNMYYPWQVYNTNYSSYNLSSLDEIQEKKVVEDAIDDLSLTMLNLHGIVSSKYDLVGHSMGGLVARKFSQSEKNAFVNRLITLNTPNYGSELANLGVDYLIPGFITLVSKISGLAFRNILAGNLLKYVLQTVCDYMISPDGPYAAISDLRTNSSAIQEINSSSKIMMANGTPVHAVCSHFAEEGTIQDLYALNQGNDFVDSFEGMLSFYNMLYKWTDEPTTTGELLLSYIFNGLNDGVVSYKSQKGGLTGEHITTMEDLYYGLFGIDSRAHHIMTNHWYDTLSEISTLLCMSPLSSRYASSFIPLSPVSSPKRMPLADADVEFKEASDSTFLKLSVTKTESERTLKIHIDKSDDIEHSMVFSCIGKDKMLVGTDSTDYVFKIPELYEGTIQMCALGRTHDFALVADTALTEFKRVSEPMFLFFEGARNKTMIKGQSLTPNVLVGWSYGETDYVEPNYTYSVEGILNSSNGIVTAMSEGECDLIANFEGMSDTIHVNVIAPLEEDAIKNIGYCDIKNQCSLVYDDCQLVISFDHPYEGTIKVDVFDVTGMMCLTRTKNFNITSNERIYLDLSELKRQVYFVMVKTKNGISNLKLVK